MSLRSRGRIGGWTLLGETTRMAAAQPAASMIAGLIIAAVCGVILTTTGRTVQAEQDVLSQIDDAGTRSITITDAHGTAGLTASAIPRVSRLSQVDWALGLGVADDVQNAAVGEGGTRTPSRVVHGQLPLEVSTTGRPPAAGEALVGSEAMQTLGLDMPAGGVHDGSENPIAIVGSFDASEPLEFLNSGLLVAAAPDSDAAIRSVQVLATSPENVENLTGAVIAVLDPADTTALSVTTSQALADVRAAVAGELGQYSRTLALTVLAIGLVLVTLTIYGAVTLRRQDFGRRRALGASRSNIVMIVALQHLIIGILGAAIGTLAGAVMVWRWTGAMPRLAFTLAVAILAILASVAAALLPAFVAAWRQPVRVLRVP
jgi:putative ABC transport system permease protein